MKVFAITLLTLARICSANYAAKLKQAARYAANSKQRV